jgi:hypothetical protein
MVRACVCVYLRVYLRVSRSEFAVPLVMRPKGRRASQAASSVFVDLDDQAEFEEEAPRGFKAMDDVAEDEDEDEEMTPAPTARRRSIAAASSGSR